MQSFAACGEIRFNPFLNELRPFKNTIRRETRALAPTKAAISRCDERE